MLNTRKLLKNHLEALSNTVTQLEFIRLARSGQVVCERGIIRKLIEGMLPPIPGLLIGENFVRWTSLGGLRTHIMPLPYTLVQIQKNAWRMPSLWGYARDESLDRVCRQMGLTMTVNLPRHRDTSSILEK